MARSSGHKNIYVTPAGKFGVAITREGVELVTPVIETLEEALYHRDILRSGSISDALDHIADLKDARAELKELPSGVTRYHKSYLVAVHRMGRHYYRGKIATLEEAVEMAAYLRNAPLEELEAKRLADAEARRIHAAEVGARQAELIALGYSAKQARKRALRERREPSPSERRMTKAKAPKAVTPQRRATEAAKKTTPVVIAKPIAALAAPKPTKSSNPAPSFIVIPAKPNGDVTVEGKTGKLRLRSRNGVLRGNLNGTLSPTRIVIPREIAGPALLWLCRNSPDWSLDAHENNVVHFTTPDLADNFREIISEMTAMPSKGTLEAH